MENSKHIAGLIGPSIIAVTLSEALNAHIWVANIAPAIHFNGALLFIAGLSIVRAHNCWIRGWPIIVTLVGCFVAILSLFRMFAPELYLHGVQNTSDLMVIASAMMLCPIGIFLTFKAYGRENSKTTVHPK